jgi:hypothetical protein
VPSEGEVRFFGSRIAASDRIAFAALRRAARSQPRITAQDVREFLMAYCACFLAVSAYIA